METITKYAESELVMLLKQRNNHAFNYLYDNYSAALFTTIHGMITDYDLANDVLQEVFVKIWRQIEQYNPSKGKLFTWMMNISRNASIDMLRSKGFQNSKQNNELTENHEEVAGISNIAIDQIGLKKFIGQLKEEYKIMIELFYFQGFTQDEISKTLGIPIGTVKTRMRTALIQLRQIIK